MQPDEHPGRRRSLAIPAAAFVVLLIVVGGAVLLSLRQSLSPAHRETTPTKTYRGADKLMIDLSSADIVLRGGTGDAVRVSRTMSWNNSRPEVSVDVEDGTLAVRSNGCRHGVGFDTCRVSITVTLPATLPVSMRTESGDARLTGLTGPVRVRTSSGDVTASGLSGELDAQIDSGDLTADDVTSPRVNVIADSGNVQLTFAAVPQRVVARTSSGDLRLRVPRTGDGYAISTAVSSGDRRVVPTSRAGSAHRLDLSADSGDLTVDYAN
ncbi:DUF4097 family beta strand repeat-containing protein [Actinocatenispora rupis]|uniref:DUF4097 domain-containing protein n=1 Tax=Actinocatenispora rupis TaxID=519421 RepID=A0A8J3NCY4_9ACTN|nr:DUF4097 family beta strand repeat-containing protein [Actinocatenispora rupis]GID14794.1 hypothetical protein Aru02nite_56830 [Actinocatenispora rupis]